MTFFASIPCVLQALICGCVTWLLTGVGALIVFPCKKLSQRMMDGALGLAGGIMVAASFYSLLNPAEGFAREMGLEPLIPLTVGIISGAAVLYLADKFLPINEVAIKHKALGKNALLLLAITLHNFPEGLAIGVSIGAAANGSSLLAAVALAIGIGIQNLPEGAAIALPMRRDGATPGKAFFVGQLSAIVEPIGAVIGALAVTLINPLLPFALTFAAGAMLYVVFAEIIPEAHVEGSKHLVAGLAIVGFAIMMILDISLG